MVMSFLPLIENIISNSQGYNLICKRKFLFPSLPLPHSFLSQFQSNAFWVIPSNNQPEWRFSTQPPHPPPPDEKLLEFELAVLGTISTSLAMLCPLGYSRQWLGDSVVQAVKITP